MATFYKLIESAIHGKQILMAVIETSANAKTGNMVQVYYLNPNMKPTEAAKIGADELVCGSCPQRHFLNGGCYVTIMHGPNNVYKAWERAGKPNHDEIDIIEACYGRRVRFGAYGDPAHTPAYLAAEMISSARSHTMYTHQWKHPHITDLWAGKGMASLDHPSQIKHAEALGWKWFLAVDNVDQMEAYPQGQLCANERDSETQCRDCMVCDGSQESIFITTHGTRQAKFDLTSEKRKVPTKPKKAKDITKE